MSANLSMLISLNLEYLMKEYPNKPFHVYLCQMDAALCERVIEEEPPASLLELLPRIFIEINDLLSPNFINKDVRFFDNAKVEKVLKAQPSSVIQFCEGRLAYYQERNVLLIKD
jgi:hypothetical protein